MEDTKQKIENFVETAEYYQRLEIANLPNTVIQVYPDKKRGKIAQVGIMTGGFKPMILTAKRFEAIKELFSNKEFADKLEQLINIVDDIYGRKTKKDEKITKIEI